MIAIATELDRGAVTTVRVDYRDVLAPESCVDPLNLLKRQVLE
jgi:hypothetical protein